jgi:hypothetical protein
MRVVIDWAQRSGYSRLLLWVVDGNTNAERLYERSGFQRTGAVQEIRPGDVEHEMELRL